MFNVSGFFSRVYCVLLILITLSISKYNFAQEAPTANGIPVIGVKFHYGFIWAHREKMAHLVRGHIPGIEITLAKYPTGQRLWQQQYNNPEYGLCFVHYDLGNPEQLGSADGLGAYINFNLNRSERFKLNLKFGPGVGYISKVFDRLDNYKNIAISSHVNVLILLSLEANWFITPRWAISSGLTMNHFSNGGYKMPNLGINVVSANIGAKYLFDKRTTPQKKFPTPILGKRKTSYQFLAAFGVRELEEVWGKKYLAYTVSAEAHRAINTKQKLGIGFDIFYDNSLIDFLDLKEIKVKNNVEIIRPGFKLSHDLAVGDLSFVFQMGAYLYQKDDSDGLFYHRIALRYLCKEHWIFNFSLKSHFAVASYIEWGLGYKL